MDRTTRRGTQRRRKAKTANGAKDGEYDTNGNSSVMRSPPPRSRSLLQQQDKDQGDGTAVSDSESDDETDSDKETTYHTLLQALNTILEETDLELKKSDKHAKDEDGNSTLETTMEYKERMLELRKKVQMIEDGSFAEYCRRCLEFKEERARSLETAKQHKELQLKNVEDLRLFDLQRAENLYLTAKQTMKDKMKARIQAMLDQVAYEIEALDKQEAERKEDVNPAAENDEPVKQTANTKDQQMDDKEWDENDEEPSTKKIKLDFSTLKLTGTLVDTVKAYQQGYKKLDALPSFHGLSKDDIDQDIRAVCSDWKVNPTTQPAPLETLPIHFARGILWCGKYIFDEGDEVVVSSKVMKQEYVGVIHALTSDAVYLRLNSGEKARVYYSLLETLRCEMKPILRGNAGLKNLQSSGWVRCEPF